MSAMWRNLNRAVGCVLLCSASLGFATSPQTWQTQQLQQAQSGKLPYAIDRASIPDAVARVKSGDFDGMHVDLIARAGAAEATPALEEQFSRVQDPLLKRKIAAGLVRLGEKDDTYWEFLLKEAKVAIDSDAPNFMSYDSAGKATGGPSPEFEAWLKSRGAVDIDSAAQDSIYWSPGRVILLGWSRDPRAVPYLRQALSSPNYMIEIAAAKGLAEIGDENSIPLIINACQKAPKEVAEAMAESLVYFDDEAAQSAVDRFIDKESAKIYRDDKASGRKTKPLTAPLYDSSAKQ